MSINFAPVEPSGRTVNGQDVQHRHVSSTPSRENGDGVERYGVEIS